MAEVILITGGSRSGKSFYAQQLAEGLPGRRVFVATCPRVDEEIAERICRHQKEREGSGWVTVEEAVDLVGVLKGLRDCEVVLVDCLTLWVNNLMYEAEQRGGQVDEEEIERLTGEVMALASGWEGSVIFVSNEVGMGIVPENALARRYRDLVGRCNQGVARAADRVVLMVSGLAMDLK